MLNNIILSFILLWVFSYLFVTIDQMIDNIIDFIKYKILKQKVKITRSFNVFEDLKTSLFRNLYLNFYRFFLHIKDFPIDSYRDVKWFIQRGKRGYSDSDVWGFDYYLTDVIIGGLKQLHKNRHGYPITLSSIKYLDKDGNPTREGDTVNSKNWDRILKAIIATFKTAKRIENDHWYYQESQNYSEKRADKYRKFQRELRAERPKLYEKNFGYVMSKDECKQYEQGWKHFQKFFFNLWD